MELFGQVRYPLERGANEHPHPKRLFPPNLPHRHLANTGMGWIEAKGEEKLAELRSEEGWALDSWNPSSSGRVLP